MFIQGDIQLYHLRVIDSSQIEESYLDILQ
jgi:hypothetical protein